MRAALLALLLLSACNKQIEPEPRIIYREVKVQIPVSCMPKDPPLREEPTYPDSDQALREAPDADVRYNLMAAGRFLREQWLSEARPAIKVCRETP